MRTLSDAHRRALLSVAQQAMAEVSMRQRLAEQDEAAKRLVDWQSRVEKRLDVLLKEVAKGPTADRPARGQNVHPSDLDRIRRALLRWRFNASDVLDPVSITVIVDPRVAPSTAAHRPALQWQAKTLDVMDALVTAGWTVKQAARACAAQLVKYWPVLWEKHGKTALDTKALDSLPRASTLTETLRVEYYRAHPSPAAQKRRAINERYERDRDRDLASLTPRQLRLLASVITPRTG